MKGSVPSWVMNKGTDICVWLNYPPYTSLFFVLRILLNKFLIILKYVKKSHSIGCSKGTYFLTLHNEIVDIKGLNC